MKQKKTKPALPSQFPPQPPVRTDSRIPFDTIWVCLYGVLLFFAMTIQTGRMSIILILLALALSIGRASLRRLRACLCLPVTGMLAYALMNGLAAIYSPFGGTAVRELYKLAASFSLSVILLTRFEKRHVQGLLWDLAAVCAIISLLCVDLSSWGTLFGLFQAFAEALGENYSSALKWVGRLRINGIYSDANLTGAMLGTAMLVQLHLTHTSKVWWKRCAACLLLGISGVGFLTAMSRGAMLCFCIAALAYLAAERENRLELFFLMLFTAVSILAAGGPAMLKMEVPGSPLPVLACFACGALIFLLDRGLSRRAAGCLKGHGKLVLAVLLALCVLTAAGAAAALNLTKPYTFERDGELFYRGISLPAGEYRVSGDWNISGDAQLYVYCRTWDGALIGEETDLYRGPLDNVPFSVPEGSARVYFQIRADVGDVLRTVTLSDGTNVPMAYRFLPDVVSSRLQDDLFANSSYLRRVQFMKDAWTIFQSSPVIGHGLGSTENLYTSVQPFFYESLYVHNHILQAMDDMGLLGLFALLALLLGSLWLILKRLWRTKDTMAAMMLACWVMMNIHSLMEINFSIRAFQCEAFLLLLLPALLYAEPLSKSAAKWCGLAAAGFIWIYLAVFGALLESHRMVERAAASFSANNIHTFMEELERYIRRDVFDHEDYQLTYVSNGVMISGSRYSGNVQQYVKELRKSGTFYACTGLARYYYLPLGEIEEVFASYQEGVAQEAANKDAWNFAFNFYRTTLLASIEPEETDVYMRGVLSAKAQFENLNGRLLQKIQISEENQAFMNAVAAANQEGMSGQELYLYLTMVLGYGYSGD